MLLYVLFCGGEEDFDEPCVTAACVNEVVTETVVDCLLPFTCASGVVRITVVVEGPWILTVKSLILLPVKKPLLTRGYQRLSKK